MVHQIFGYLFSPRTALINSIIELYWNVFVFLEMLSTSVCQKVFSVAVEWAEKPCFQWVQNPGVLALVSVICTTSYKQEMWYRREGGKGFEDQGCGKWKVSWSKTFKDQSAHWAAGITNAVPKGNSFPKIDGPMTVSFSKHCIVEKNRFHELMLPTIDGLVTHKRAKQSQKCCINNIIHPKKMASRQKSVCWVRKKGARGTEGAKNQYTQALTSQY